MRGHMLTSSTPELLGESRPPRQVVENENSIIGGRGANAYLAGRDSGCFYPIFLFFSPYTRHDVCAPCPRMCDNERNKATTSASAPQTKRKLDERTASPSRVRT